MATGTLSFHDSLASAFAFFAFSFAVGFESGELSSNWAWRICNTVTRSLSDS